MTNRHRNESSVVIRGRTYRLRASLGALAEIEDARGCSISALFARMSKGRAQINDILAMGAAMSAAAGAPIPVEELRMETDSGEPLPGWLTDLFEACVDAFAGGGGDAAPSKKKTAKKASTGRR